ncbi:ribosome-binding factor A [compost metagenome]
MLTGLARAVGFLRREVGRRVRLKFVPDLDFALDTAFDNAARMDTLLRDLPPAPDDAAREGQAGDGQTGGDDAP